MSRRTKAAIARRSEHGREVLFSTWIGREKETLDALYKVGANVPRPITQLSSAFLMAWIGDEEEAAPQLRQVRFDDPSKATRIFDFLVGQVELWLAHDIVHGDLSEYNVLFWRGRPVVIDFPQAIDPRFNHNAYSLLQRTSATWPATSSASAFDATRRPWPPGCGSAGCTPTPGWARGWRR